MTEPTGPNPYAAYVTTPQPVAAPDAPAPAAPNANPYAKYATTPPPGAERTWWDTARDVGRTAVDAVAAGTNAATFGMDIRRDALAGWLGGDYPSYSAGLEAEQKKLAERRERSPIATTVGDVAGAVAIPGAGGARLAANLGTRFGPGVVRQFGARALGYGAEGAGVGALQGASTTYTGNVEDYAKNALMGGVLGAATGGLVGGAVGPRTPTAGPRPTPTADQQYFTDSAYNLLRANPTHYDAAPFQRVAADLEARLLKRFDPTSDSAGASFRAVDQMQRMQTVTPKAIEDLRIKLNEINPINKADRKAAYEVKKTLDDFMINPPPGAVNPSQAVVAREAAETARMARDANAGLQRARAVENARTAIDDKTARTFSGLNAENNMRAWASRMTTPNETTGIVKANVKGYNAAEQEAMRNILHPGKAADLLRYGGNYFGGGGGLGALAAGGLGAGYAFGGTSDDKINSALGGAATTATGLGLRLLANRSANQRMQALQDLVGQRNPLYQRQLVNPRAMPTPPDRLAANARDAIALQLLQQARGE